MVGIVDMIATKMMTMERPEGNIGWRCIIEKLVYCYSVNCVF